MRLPAPRFTATSRPTFSAVLGDEDAESVRGYRRRQPDQVAAHRQRRAEAGRHAQAVLSWLPGGPATTTIGRAFDADLLAAKSPFQSGGRARPGSGAVLASTPAPRTIEDHDAGRSTTMQTTLVIDDQLISAATQRAAALGTTLSEIVNQALRDSLQRDAPAPASFRMITYGDASAGCRHEPADMSAVLDEEDDESARG
jgi:Bacterial antitoxin of type II TA system, VapB